MSTLSICTQYVFVQLQNVLASVGGGGGSLQVGPPFLICSYFFLKMPYYPSFFHSKMSFTRKNTEFFPRPLRSLRFNKLTNFFFSGSTLQNINCLVLTPKGSLFSLYYCHSYYSAYFVGNLFLTTHCDKFCTWKSPTIPSFLHQ